MGANNHIKARLQNTSKSWLVIIILVLNLVKLIGAVLPYAELNYINSFSASAMI
jgi:hypothetical protein